MLSLEMDLKYIRRGCMDDADTKYLQIKKDALVPCEQRSLIRGTGEGNASQWE